MADDVSVKFGADTGGLESGIQKAASSINGFGSSIASSAKNSSDNMNALQNAIQSAGDSSGNAFQRLFETMAAIPAVVSAGLGTVTGIAVSVGTAAQKSADQLNAPVEAISKFAPVAAAAGLSLQDFSNKFAVLNDNLRKGDTTTENAIKALRIDPKALGAEPAQQQIQTLMAALAGLRDNYQKTAAATVIFGSSADAVITAASRATSSLGPLSTEADRAGTTIGPELAAKIAGTRGILEQISANFREAGEAVNGVSITIYNELKPAIDWFLQGFSDSVASIAKWIEGVNTAAKTSGFLHDALLTAREGLLEVAAGMTALTKTAVDVFTSVGSTAVKVFEDIRTVGTSIWSDIGGIIQRFFDAVVTTAKASLEIVISDFKSLGSAIDAALHGNLAGVQDAFNQLGNNSKESADKIKAAWSGVIPPAASAAIADANANLKKLAADGSTSISNLSKNYLDAYAKIKKQFETPITAPKVKQGSAGDLPGNSANNSDAIKAAQAEADGEIQAAQQAYAAKKSLLDSELAMHQIGESQFVSMSKDALQDELQDEMEAYQTKLSLDGQTLASKQETLNKMAAAQAKYNLDLQKLDQDAAQKAAQSWQQTMDTINSAFTSQINGLLTGTTKWQQAFKNVLTTLTEDVIKFCATWALKQAETVAMNIVGIDAQTIAGITGANAVSAAQMSSAAASLGSTFAAIGKQIASSAAATGAGVSGFLAPFIGPAAPAVGAAAEAEVFSMAAIGGAIYDTGAWSIPRDQFAALHQGELVVPSRGGIADQFRDFMSGGGFGGRGGSGGSDTHNHYHFSPEIHMNGASARSKIDADMLVKVLKAEHARGAFIGYKPRFT